MQICKRDNISVRSRGRHTVNIQR
uniref:Uncharacterized protein n=1 Tax=Anguilla anguilla TaxID=7936 RepID=A0A0E9T8A9_ANGAN